MCTLNMTLNPTTSAIFCIPDETISPKSIDDNQLLCAHFFMTPIEYVKVKCCKKKTRLGIMENFLHE